jgi:beta-lactam-binding protein with PASTA domain
VPKLKSKTVKKAAAALAAAGCRIGKITKHHAAKRKHGKVLAQAVPAGVQVRPGTAVGVTVGR